MPLPLDDDSRRAQELRQSTSAQDAIEDSLSTNDRVIARVTDGIYRQPGSALRELIANAYDADATWVSIKTDAPKFTRITVEDNGSGMSPEAVIHLLRNIGGSAKRTEAGRRLGISQDDDVTRSPQGRALIGKLGIGIFSVSQLTQGFQIITKTAGDSRRTIIEVRLEQFADSPVSQSDGKFNAGRYRVWRESAPEAETHGTTIILTAIRPQTRDSLQSRRMWDAADAPREPGEISAQVTVPEYHIGRIQADAQELMGGPKHRLRSLPWDSDADPISACHQMVSNVWRYPQVQTQTAKLSNIFDSYLQMVWNLALALPLPYVEKGALEESTKDKWASFYRISNDARGSATKLESPDEGDLTVRSLAGLPGAAADDATPFEVTIDGVRLLRPIKYRGLPHTRHVLTRPLLFVGHLRQEFTGIKKEVSAGPLEFDAYLFWTPKVVPVEHQGVLVRIHGASGTLFDSTFFNYQISELTRLKQTTCEIYVHEGLEAALNIDRESFNTAHPHTVILTRWLHNALRQLATAQKRESQSLRVDSRRQVVANRADRIDEIVEAANTRRTDGEGVVPKISFSPRPESASGDAGYDQHYPLKRLEAPDSPPPPPKARLQAMQALEGVTKLLTVYGLLDDLSSDDQEALLSSILGVIEAAYVE